MRGFTTQRRKAGLQAPWSPEPISLAQLTMASVGNREKLSSWGPGVCQAAPMVDTLSPSAHLCPSVRISSSLLQKRPPPLLGRDYERGFVFK